MDSSSMKNSFPVIIVTGLSGSGKSSAMDVFEDMGFFTVDGLPIALASQMVEMIDNAALNHYCGIVIGMDLRQGDFVPDYEKCVLALKEKGYSPMLLFFQARIDILLKRYATTRRPHPLENEGLGLEQALDEEYKRLTFLRKNADSVIDTSSLSIHDLRRTIQAEWNSFRDAKHPLRVHIISFGFKYGTPMEADMVFDLRFLPNPYFIPELRPLSGKDTEISEYVLKDNPGKAFFSHLHDFLKFILEQFEAEGRFRLTIAIGCTGGRHRSVAVAEALFKKMADAGYTLSIEHRHLELG